MSDFTRADCEVLWLSALWSGPRLAIELERLGLSHPHRSLKDARSLRFALLALGPGVIDTDTLDVVAAQIAAETEDEDRL